MNKKEAKRVRKTCKNCGSKKCWAAGIMDWNGNDECWIKKRRSIK